MFSMRVLAATATATATAALCLCLCLSMLPSAAAAESQQCDGSAASLYERPGQEDRLKPVAQLVSSLSDKLMDNYMLRRWDGTLGTYATHLEWMYQHAAVYTDAAKDGFRHYGEHNGITYEIDDELTKAGGGDGYFRLSGEIDIPPELLIAQVMDATSLGELDHTVMYMNFLHRYSADPRSRLCLWIAAPGFPFEWRMGLDLTTYKVDDDGTFWQYSLSVPEHLPDTPSLAIRAVDRYWAYKLVPIDGGKRSKLTLLCQTNLFGWMPQFLVNMKIGEVLSDYVRTAETRGKTLISTGESTRLLEATMSY